MRHALLTYPVRVATPAVRRALDDAKLGYAGVVYSDAGTSIVLREAGLPDADVVAAYDRTVDMLLRRLGRKGKLDDDRRDILARRVALPGPANDGVKKLGA